MSYDDGLIATTEQALVIRRYSLLLRSKTIPYDEIREVRRRRNGLLNGRGRIWGTTVPGQWLNLDFKRAAKREAFTVEAGGGVTPVLTPNDPDAFADALTEHGVAVTVSGD